MKTISPERIKALTEQLEEYAGKKDLRILQVRENAPLTRWILDNLATDETAVLVAIDPRTPKGIPRLYPVNLEIELGLRQIWPDHFDIIFLDLDQRELEGVREAVLAYDLLQPDGLLVAEKDSVGIHTFLSAYRHGLQLLDGRYHVLARRRVREEGTGGRTA